MDSHVSAGEYPVLHLTVIVDDDVPGICLYDGEPGLVFLIGDVPQVPTLVTADHVPENT